MMAKDPCACEGRMPRHAESDFSFEVPPDWTNASIVVFHSPDGAAVAVSRDRILPWQTLRHRPR
jgi:hypothetical protein